MKFGKESKSNEMLMKFGKESKSNEMLMNQTWCSEKRTQSFQNPGALELLANLFVINV